MIYYYFMFKNYKLNFQLGDEKFTFFVKKKSEVPVLAKQFCEKHQLSPECV